MVPPRQKVSIFDESLDDDEDEGQGNIIPARPSPSHAQYIVPTSLRHPPAQAQPSRQDAHAQNRADNFASSRKTPVVHGQPSSSHAARQQHANVGGGGGMQQQQQQHVSHEDETTRVRKETARKREADALDQAWGSDEESRVFSPNERKRKAAAAAAAASEQPKRTVGMPFSDPSSRGAAHSASSALLQNRTQIQRGDRTVPDTAHVRDRQFDMSSGEEDKEEEEYVPKKRKDVRGSKNNKRGHQNDFEYDSESDSDSDISDTELVRRPVKKKASVPAKTNRNAALPPKANTNKNVARQRSGSSNVASSSSSRGMLYMCVCMYVYVYKNVARQRSGASNVASSSSSRGMLYMCARMCMYA